MKRTRWIFALLSIVVLLTCTSGAPYQQRTPEGSLYFPRTGFTVSGEFQKMFESADNPLLVFGLPISGELKHSFQPGVQVQYFQRARMELDSNGPEGQQIRLAALGKILYEAGGPGVDANIDISSAACRYFMTYGHYVCFAFLQFYDAHNGAVFFGEPVSEVENEGGRLVQYFERARMEWWPEKVSGMRVVLTDLGMLDYRSKVGNPQAPEPGNIGTPEQLLVRVFPAKPLVGSNEMQTIYVIVQDQLFQPVRGALVTIGVTQEDGSYNQYRLPETDIHGISKQENIPAGNSKPHQMVAVTVTVSMIDVQTVETYTWYRIWW